MGFPLIFQVMVSRVREKYANLHEAMLEDWQGWKICGCVLVITIVRSGITYSFGVFVVTLEQMYSRPLAEENWVGTLSFCISLSCAPVTVAFIRSLKYRGYRWSGLMGTVILTASCLGSSFVRKFEWMFLTHSLLYGVGSSLIYMASSLVIGEYFDNNHKYHVMATSILLCGYPVGSLLFNPINAWLVTRFGWRIAFRVAAVLILISGTTCCWHFTSKDTQSMQRLEEEPEEPVVEVDAISPSQEESPVKVKRKCCTLEEVKARPEIVIWYIANCISYLGFYMPFVNLAFYMELKHIPPIKSAWAITMLSLFECITYIFASIFGDYLKGKLIYVNILAASALAIICLLWPLVDVSFGVIIVIAICMGAFLGLTIVYTYAASGEVTGLPIDIAWSHTNLWSGIGILIGPFFSGLVYDLRQSYDDVFWVVGSLFIVDAFLFASIPIIQNRRERREKQLSYNEIGGGIVGSRGDTQTLRISTKRSASKSSLANEEDGVMEYGTTATTAHTMMTKPMEEDIRLGSVTNGSIRQPYASNGGGPAPGEVRERGPQGQGPEGHVGGPPINHVPGNPFARQTQQWQ